MRDRVEDVPLLAEHFLALSLRKMKRRARLTEENVRDLQRYGWPGNVRELVNAIERAVITSEAGQLQFGFLADGAVVPGAGPVRNRLLTDPDLQELERQSLLAALERAQGQIYGKGGAAELLGIKPTTFASRLDRFGIERPSGD